MSVRYGIQGHEGQGGVVAAGCVRARGPGRGGRVISHRFEVADAQLDSVLGRTSPIVKLAIALVWLIGLAGPRGEGPPGV